MSSQEFHSDLHKEKGKFCQAGNDEEFYDFLETPLDTKLESDTLNGLNQVESKTFKDCGQNSCVNVKGIKDELTFQNVLQDEFSHANLDKYSTARTDNVVNDIYSNQNRSQTPLNYHVFENSNHQPIPTDNSQSDENDITVHEAAGQSIHIPKRSLLSTADSWSDDTVMVGLDMIKSLNKTSPYESLVIDVSTRQMVSERRSLSKSGNISCNSSIPCSSSTYELSTYQTPVHTFSVSDFNRQSVLSDNLDVVGEGNGIAFGNVDTTIVTSDNPRTDTNITQSKFTSNNDIHKRRLRKSIALKELCKRKSSDSVLSRLDTTVTDKHNHDGQISKVVSSKPEQAGNTHDVSLKTFEQCPFEENMHLAMTEIDNVSTSHQDYGQGEGGSLQDDYVVVGNISSLMENKALVESVQHDGTDIDQLSELLRSFEQQQVKEASELECQNHVADDVAQSITSSTFETLAISSDLFHEDTSSEQHKSESGWLEFTTANMPDSVFQEDETIPGHQFTKEYEHKCINGWLECSIANMPNSLFKADAPAVPDNISTEGQHKSNIHNSTEFDYINIDALKNSVDSIAPDVKPPTKTGSLPGISQKMCDSKAPGYRSVINCDCKRSSDELHHHRSQSQTHSESLNELSKHNSPQSNRGCVLSDMFFNCIDYHYTASNSFKKESIKKDTNSKSTYSNDLSELLYMTTDIPENETSWEVHDGEKGEFCDIDNNAVDNTDFEFFESSPKYQEVPFFEEVSRKAVMKSRLQTPKHSTIGKEQASSKRNMNSTQCEKTKKDTHEKHSKHTQTCQHLN